MASGEGRSAADVVRDRYRPHPLRELVPYARNSRKHTKQQIDHLKGSLATFGWVRPIAMADGTILAGHGVTLAALKLAEQGGCPRDWPDPRTAPVVDLSHLPEAERRAYVIADNKLAEVGSSWDDALLAMELGELAPELDLSNLGFSEQELAKLLGDGGNAGLTDPDAAPAPPAIPTARPGDVWLLGRHRLVCGDSTDAATVAACFANNSPRLMVTDQPYGVAYDPDRRARGMTDGATRAKGLVKNDHKGDWREAWALFPGAVAYVWHGYRMAFEAEEGLRAAGFAVRAQIVWSKTRHVLSPGNINPATMGYNPQHECAFYAVREGGRVDWHGDRSQSTVWQIDHLKSDTGHGTQKPVECMRRPIENNSGPGQVVYDPFCGSGTTIIAAEQTGRACFGIELDPAYIDVAIQRWQAFTGQAAHLDEDGRDFADIGAARRRGEAA